jgi:hypothetical protein
MLSPAPSSMPVTRMALPTSHRMRDSTSTGSAGPFYWNEYPQVSSEASHQRVCSSQPDDRQLDGASHRHFLPRKALVMNSAHRCTKPSGCLQAEIGPGLNEGFPLA